MTSPRPLLRELMRQAASAGSLDAVYQSALECVRHGLGIERASLLLFDSTDTMRFVAWSGLSDEYRQAVDGHSPWSRSETNAMPMLVSDVASDPSFVDYRLIMGREDIRALAFIPLQFGASLLGKFMLYYREPHVFSASEIAMAEQIADYLVFALEHHRIAVALEEQLVSERDLRGRAETEAARLHVALATGRMGTWDWELSTGRIRWSEALEQMCGLAPGTFGGTMQAIVQLIHPLDADVFTRAVKSTESSPGRDQQLEFRVIRPDGMLRWLATRGRFLHDSDGISSRMVGVATDITEAKRLAEAAAEADRRKDNFLATLAHELRNPLAAVRIGVAVIRKENADPNTVTEYCTILERQLRHLTRLVDDLLHVADITRRGLPMEKRRIDLSAVVVTALEQNRALIEEAGHELGITLPPEPIILDADPERLVQVLANLLTNAVKYTPRGGKITLAVAREGNQVCLSVKDSGLGIPTDKLDSVFEMFGQLDRTLETGHKGLGIGLALASALVSLHGGRIEAHSEGLGTGSEFRVWLPLAPPMISAPRPAVPVPARGFDDIAHCRVLIVDDNKDVAVAMSRWVRQLGHEVRVALDGADAVKIVEEFRPAVVLLDIAMPKMNGYDVARALRSLSWGSEMTLVAVTGWGQEDDRRRSTEAGFDRHMTKPVDPIVLEAFLDSIDRRQSTSRRAMQWGVDGVVSELLTYSVAHEQASIAD